MGKRRLAIAYAILVGAPLLVLIGIVKVGGEARAPIATGGVWDVQADFRALGLGQCTPLKVAGQAVLTVSQSGRHLAVTLDRMEGTGSVENSTVNAFVPVEDDSCGSRPAGVYLRGDIKVSAAEEQIMGFIGISGCVNCTEVPFRAIRRPASPRVGP